jgi:hypothetical protein
MKMRLRITAFDFLLALYLLLDEEPVRYER